MALTKRTTWDGSTVMTWWLLRHNGVTIDVIGQIGADPAEWGSGDTSTKDNTLIRKPEIVVGDRNGQDAFDPAVEWNGLPQNNFDDLGTHEQGAGTIRRSTYAIGGMVVAVRVTGSPDTQDDGLFYLYNDHLGSVSRVVDTAGSVVSQARYLPFGEWRTEPGTLPTNRGFTGHVQNNLSGADDLGLIYMNARYYVPYLNRFLSADTIVPNPTNPQSLNRYSYVLNSPVNFTDPSGLIRIFGYGNCDEEDDLLTLPWRLFPNDFCLPGNLGCWSGSDYADRVQATYPIPEFLGYTTRPLGFHEVLANYKHIFTVASSYRIPPTILAASIMAQGNSWQRYVPFFERLQVNSLTVSRDWPGGLGQVLGCRASVGSAQLTPNEMNKYLPGHNANDLFQDEVAIEGMAAKLANADTILNAGGVSYSETDRWMVLAVAQNNGPGSPNLYIQKGGKWDKFYEAELEDREPSSDWLNLGKILKNVRILSRYVTYAIPGDIDLDRWQRIINTNGQNQ